MPTPSPTPASSSKNEMITKEPPTQNTMPMKLSKKSRPLAIGNVVENFIDT